MLYSVLEFLSSNKVVVVGAAATLSEMFVIFWNMRKKLKSNKPVVMMGDLTPETRKTTLRDIVWACNPINVFRKA